MTKQRIIDIHTHILYGVDDGAKTPAESLAMAERAYEQGVRAIVATPHMYPERYTDRTAEIKEKAEELAALVGKRLKEKGYTEPMEFFTGQENGWCSSLPEMLAAGTALTLADSRFVLVEFDYGALYDVIFAAVRTLTDQGYVPVIAHVERIRSMYRPENLQEMISAGAWITMNYDTLTGSLLDPSVRTARRYVRDGAIAILTSDMHGTVHRPPEYRKTFDWLERHLPKEQIEDLTWNAPAAILDAGHRES